MSNALDSVNNLLLSGGAPTFKFENISDTVRGTIVAASDQQQTDLVTGDPLFWKDGKPKMQVVITLQTELRDPQNTDDDGQRRIFVKGQMLNAVSDALRKAQAKLEVGGTLAVKFERQEEPKQRGFNGQKIYVAAYQAPAPSTDAANDLLGAPSSPSGPFDEAPAQQTGVAPADLLG